MLLGTKVLKYIVSKYSRQPGPSVIAIILSVMMQMMLTKMTTVKCSGSRL